MPELTTDRLRMVPFGAAEVAAALADRAELARLVDAAVPAAWPGPDMAELLGWRAERLQEAPELARWTGMVIHSADRVVIGDMGSLGGPDASGALEIGYGIIPEYRGQGYAPEMVRALIGWALEQPEVTRVTAECEADNVASVRVLEKVGMRRVGQRDSLLLWETSGR